MRNFKEKVFLLTWAMLLTLFLPAEENSLSLARRLRTSRRATAAAPSAHPTAKGRAKKSAARSPSQFVRRQQCRIATRRSRRRRPLPLA